MSKQTFTAEEIHRAFAAMFQGGGEVMIRGEGWQLLLDELIANLVEVNAERREVGNPSDKITIDYRDREAAQIAVLAVGGGRYNIKGEGGMPLLLFGSFARWVQETYGMEADAWQESVGAERLIRALRSMRLEGERSSMNDIAGHAHEIADKLEAKYPEGKPE